MLIELFVFFEIITIGLFITSFFTKQELLWAITALMSGTLMFTSYSIETYVYEFNATMSAYVPVIVTHNYPYLTGINLLFFGLSIVLGIFDIFDKYGNKLVSHRKE
jgi:hypothetical protein